MTVGELLVRLGVDLAQYSKNLQDAEKQTKATGLRLGDIFQNAFSFTLGMGMFEAIKRGFQGIVGEAVNFNAMMEQARIGFTTMLGSAEKAQAFLNEMADFAARTPFEFPELLDAAKRMMAMGFAAGEVLPTLKAVGDAAAGLGVGKEGIDRITLALGQMRAKSKVSAEEMMQLTEAGVPAWEILAEAMGKSTAEVMELAERGLIPANQAIQILVEGMEKRFPDMMKNMENTWEGVTSTIRDVWRMTIGALTSNLFKGLVRWLQGIRDWATEFYNTFRQFGLSAALTKMFGAEFAGVISTITAILRGFGNTAKAVALGIARNWAIIRPIVLGVVTAFLSFKVATWIITLAQRAVTGLAFVTAVLRGEVVSTSGILNFVARAVQIYRLQLHLASMAGIQHIGVLQSLRIALYSVWSALGPIGIAILAITGALSAGIGLWMKYSASVERANMAKINQAMQQQANALNQQNGQLSISSADASKGINEQAEAMKKANKAASDNIQSFDEVHQIMQETADAASDVANAIGAPEVATPAMTAPDIGGIPAFDMGMALEQQKPTLAGFWEWIKQGFLNVWDTVKSWTLSAWNGITSTLQGIWNGLVGVAQTVWNSISNAVVSAWKWLSGLVSGVFGPIADFISTTWQNILSTSSNIWGIIRDTVSSIWDSLKQTATNVWQAIADFVAGTWDNLKTTASTIWQSIWDFLTGLWNNIWITASTIWQTIHDLITGKIDLRQAVTIIWNAIRDFFAQTWNDIQGTASEIWGAIAGFFGDTWQGLKNLASTIWNEIATFFSDTWNSIKDAGIRTWEEIKTFFSETWENLKAAAQEAWNTIETYIVDPIRRAWNRINEIAGQLKQDISEAWAGIKSTISSWAGKILDEITQPFKDAKEYIDGIIREAYDWGKNLISNIVDGIKSAISNVKTAVTNVASTIKGYLGFSSPTEEGPGRYADQWAPNLMRMYADGILNNVGMVKAAVATVAESLSGMAISPTPALAGNVTGSRALTPAATTEIHLHVGTLIADDLGLKKLTQEIRRIWIAEEQRIGGDAR